MRLGVLALALVLAVVGCGASGSPKTTVLPPKSQACYMDDGKQVWCLPWALAEQVAKGETYFQGWDDEGTPLPDLQGKGDYDGDPPVWGPISTAPPATAAR